MRVSLDRPRGLPRADALVWRALKWSSPELPALPEEAPRRHDPGDEWTPAGTLVLARHRSLTSQHRVHSNSEHSPRGYTLEWRVGVVGAEPRPSTRRLTVEGDVLRMGDADHEPPVEQLVLGHVEQLPFVLLAPLEIWRVPETGQEVLAGDPWDPIRGETEFVRHLGYIETVPVSPLAPGERIATWGLRVLTRRLDRAAGRHVYEAIEPAGEPLPDGTARLGSLWHAPGPAFVPFAPDGAGASAPAVAEAARWTVAPLRWAGPRWGGRAAAARALRLARAARAGAPPALPAGVAGYLRREPAEGWSPLFSAVHPVVGDRFLSRSALEASDLGYRLEGVAGHICDAHADRRAVPGADIPWASRFGRSRRYVEGPLPG